MRGNMFVFLQCGIVTFFIVLADGIPQPQKSDNFWEQEDQTFWRASGNLEIERMLKVKPNYNLAKNVIILVGDGMGINTVSVSRIYKGQKNGNSGEEEQLAWERFPVSGLSKTYNTNRQVPDSAGTATALFTGVKTRMGFMGVDSRPAYNECDSDVYERSKLKSMLHWAQEAGKETGIVTTTRITHATPGSLYSHVTNRDFESDSDLGEDIRGQCQDIAHQLIHNEAGQKAKVIFGGGKRNFVPQKDQGRRVKNNLIDEYKAMKGQKNQVYSVLENTMDLENWTQQDNQDYVLGLFAMSHMSYEVDRDTSPKGQPSLSQMATAAVNRLAKSPTGFFLMVESGRIDHAHHETNAFRALDEAYELDKTVAEILSNPNINLDETLIIVTADHSHSMTFNGYPKRGNSIFGYVYEPKDEKNQQYSEYADGTRRAYSTISYANGDGFHNHFTGDQIVPWKDLTTMDVENVDYLQPAMMPGPGGDESHGGEDVGIYAQGPMAHLLSGVHEQNFIAHAMAYASCVGDYADKCDRRASLSPQEIQADGYVSPNEKSSAQGHPIRSHWTLSLGTLIVGTCALSVLV